MTYENYQTSQNSGEPMTLFRFASGSSRTWLYTSESHPVLRGGETYNPEAIRHGSSEQNGAEAIAQAFEITLPSSTSLAAEFKPFLPVSPITVIVYSRHRADTDYVPIFIGECAAAAFDNDGVATISCNPLSYKLGRNIPWPRYCHDCNWAVYSEACGVSRDAFKTIASVTTVNGYEISAPEIAPKEDGWFTAGVAVRNLTGETRWVVAHVGGTVTLISPFTALASGESVTLYAGCDGLETTCNLKFDNLPRHAGFPDVPTKNPYKDNIMGTGNSAGAGSGGGLGAIGASMYRGVSN